MIKRRLIRKLSISVKSFFWALAPAGGFVNPLIVLSYLLKFKKGKLKYLISSLYPKHEVFFVNSGKSALFLALNNIRALSSKKLCFIPAYTCPDVASSALLAGCEIGLLDTLSATSLILAAPDQSDDIGSIVGTNLYGTDDSDLIRKFCAEKGVTYIDDICQAALSNRAGAELGISGDTISVISFGRGKAYSGVGGGMLFVPKGDKFQAILHEITLHYKELAKPHTMDGILCFLKLCLYWILERPYFYWLIVNIPFLGIGETKVFLDFPLRRASVAEMAVMYAFLKRREQERSVRLKKLGLYKEAIKESKEGKDQEEVPVRLPIVLAPEVRALMFDTYRALCKKYGISSSYPKTISEYDEFKDYVVAGSDQNAKKVCAGLITLPTHKFVRKRDVTRIIRLIKKVQK